MLTVSVETGDAVTMALGIVTYNNSPECIQRLALSIDQAVSRLERSGDSARIYTIDCGGPTTWPITEVSRARLPARGNLGFGGGMNVLLNRAFLRDTAKYFLCINPDGMLHRDLLQEMLQTVRLYPSSLVEARQFPEEHPKPYDPETGLTLWATGACLLIPQELYQVIGGFDPNIFMYMEDVDYSWRARMAGFSIRVAPRALFAHSVLDRKPNRTIDKYYYTSARYLAHKWGKPAQQAAYEAVLRNHRLVEAGELTELSKIKNAQALAASGVADFSYGFGYAPLRW